MQPTRSLLLAAVLFSSAIGSATAQGVYVANYGDASVSVLDATTLQPVGLDIPILRDGFPEGVALTRDHRWAFVALDWSSWIAVIDTRRHETVNYIRGQALGR